VPRIWLCSGHLLPLVGGRGPFDLIGSGFCRKGTLDTGVQADQKILPRQSRSTTPRLSALRRMSRARPAWCPRRDVTERRSARRLAHAGFRPAARSRTELLYKVVRPRNELLFRGTCCSRCVHLYPLLLRQ
jgi:hypothetical protein